jgi:folate-binding protein YgfZ
MDKVETEDTEIKTEHELRFLSAFSATSAAKRFSAVLPVASAARISLRSIIKMGTRETAVSLETEQVLTGYDEALTGAVFYPVPDPGYLRIGGADQSAFIQRQTTNDIQALAPGRALLTVLTSATARILDVWRLVAEPDGSLGAITLPGRGTATARFLRSHIFFMDKVTVTDASASFAQIEIFGPQAGRAVTQIGQHQPPALDEIASWPVDDVPVRAIGTGHGWLLIAPSEHSEALQERLSTAGAVPLSPEAYEVLRVEAGRPGPAYELTDDYTPLEANLDAAISDRKGCYTGQEIIARQITYDKITRRLAGLRLDAMVAVGAALQVEGHTVGAITSAVQSPRHGPIALAVIRRPHHAPGTAVTVVDAENSVNAVTVALPF